MTAANLPGADRHRWVQEEPQIPFKLRVLYENSRIIVVDKPHFLATMPRGMWYRQTALVRLRQMYGQEDITPAHRLDRMTAGVVLFVRKPACRGAYQLLFEHHHVVKTYECLAPSRPVTRPAYGTIESLNPPAVFPLLRRSHIVKQRGRLQAYEEPGLVNAQTIMKLPDHQEAELSGSGYRRYLLYPASGRTHQLRVHMNSVGLPILGDNWYPRILSRSYDDFSKPLQLIARSLSFRDPVSKELLVFHSRVPLSGVVAD